METHTPPDMRELEEKIDAIYKSVEKTRKYILWSFITSLVIFLLPLIGVLLAIPWLLNIMSNVYQGLL